MNVTIFLTLKVLVLLWQILLYFNGLWIIDLETVFKQKIKIESDANLFSQKDQTRFSNLIFLKIENVGS